MREYPESARLLERARRVTPAGAQTRSKAASMFVEGAFPALLESGRGCRVTDVDGHGYVDWILGLGAVGLGYCHPAVDAAVHRQVDRGASFSLPTRLEAELAERLVDLVPCAEQVRFVKTGSEATEAAMRIARAATGREIVLSVGYHGWHSVHDAAKPEHPGVPRCLTDAIVDVAYNDLRDLKAWLRFDYRDDYGRHKVAAVLIEPVLFEPLAPGYLEGVRDLCASHGAVLIFDEVVTGFRWAIAGAQEYFGVTPDLACFGKAMANGYPLACVLGRRDLMEYATHVSGTFGGEAVSLAASLATVDVYAREPVVATIEAAGHRFVDGFNALADEIGAPFAAVGYPQHPRVVCTLGGAEASRRYLSLFLQETAERGALFHVAGFNVSYAHGCGGNGDPVGESLEACRGALEVIRDGAELRGAPYVEAFRRAAEAGHGGRRG